MPTRSTQLAFFAAVLALALCSPAQAAKREPWRRCVQPLRVGPGRAAIPKWYFNAKSGTCEKFLWGGVRPNGNNFISKAACKFICKDVPICELPPAPGSGDVQCMAYMPRWAFDPDTNTCKEFIYGGCGGNKNNFMDEASCLKRCQHKPMPLDS